MIFCFTFVKIVAYLRITESQSPAPIRLAANKVLRPGIPNHKIELKAKTLIVHFG